MTLLLVRIAEIVRALEREAQNTDTDPDPRWSAARELRHITDWETRTLICEIDTQPKSELVRPQMSKPVTREQALEAALALLLRGCPDETFRPGSLRINQAAHLNGAIIAAKAALNFSGVSLDPAAWNMMLHALYECEEYFDGRQDVVDGSYGEPEANKEMKLLMEVREAIAKAGG